jgi:hypothetical protein
MYHIYRDKLARHLGGLLLCLLLAGPVLAQSSEQRYTLRGRVTDAAGQGLPGATVLLNGTTFGVSSDADGAYTVSATLAPGSYTLTFSLIGYKSEARPLRLGTDETVTTDVAITEAQQKLDEVVVVGSTVTVNRRELGNAISTIKGAELTQSGSGSVLNSLQGKVPGAQITQTSGDPAGAMSVRLRGVHSLIGSSDPLYVIDGVIISNASTNVSQLAVSNDIGQANAGALAPEAGDRRLPFHIRANPGTTQNLAAGFYTANGAPIPVYVPGEMLLIRAEAFARKGDLPNAVLEWNKVRTKTPATDVYGLGAGLAPYAGPLAAADVLTDILRNRNIELALQGFRLEDSRRFGRPGPGVTGAERNRNFYPYPRVERENNSQTPADPVI